MTERGQLATEAQRNDMDTLVERLEDLKASGQLGPFEDENMVSARSSTILLLCSGVVFGEAGEGVGGGVCRHDYEQTP